MSQKGLVMPIIENIVQGSEQWHLYRSAHIMATDCGIILGSNPWRTPLELWEEKLTIRSPVELNNAMRRGTELEPEARNLACEIIGMQFEPCVYESEVYPWMAASLDGISKCGSYVLEIKCPNVRTHEMALNGMHIPEYYLDQMRHQLAVTGCEKVYYFSYRPEHEIKHVCIEVHRSDHRIEIILEKEKEFWLQLCTMMPPEEPWRFEGK